MRAGDLMEKRTNITKILNRDLLKYIALTAMFIGHFLVFTIKELAFFGMPKSVATVLVYLQYIAPPIFFFFIAEGFHYTKSKKDYAIRLLIFAIITQVPFILLAQTKFDVIAFFTSWNVIMELFLGLLVLIIWESKKSLWLRILLIAICCAASHVFKVEWGIAGLLITLSFHIFREKPVFRFGVFELTMLGYTVATQGGFKALFTSWGLILPTTLAMILITFFYNGKKGRYPKFSKYFFYIFYPAHLLLIYCVKAFSNIFL